MLHPRPRATCCGAHLNTIHVLGRLDAFEHGLGMDQTNQIILDLIFHHWSSAHHSNCAHTWSLWPSGRPMVNSRPYRPVLHLSEWIGPLNREYKRKCLLMNCQTCRAHMVGWWVAKLCGELEPIQIFMTQKIPRDGSHGGPHSKVHLTQATRAGLSLYPFLFVCFWMVWCYG